MNTLPTPPGFHERRLPHAHAWFRSGREKPILSFWQKAGGRIRLSEAMRRHPQSLRFPGRQPVFAAPIPGAGTLVVRPCAHGGWWGRLARNLYFGPGRAWREVRASEHLSHCKIPSPVIEAVVFYPAGAFCRIEVVTPMIAGGRDLVHYLAARPGPAQRTRIFAAIRKLFDQLHRHGIYHADVNARNILLAPAERGSFKAWLLDVDAVRFGDSGCPVLGQANRHRLLRSLLKRARLGDLGWSEAEVAKLWREIFPRP